KLTIAPGALDFTDNDTEKTFTITNSGSGALTWSIDTEEAAYNDDDDGWIFAATPKGGIITDTAESVTITVSRKGLDAGSYSADLPVNSVESDTLDLGIEMEVGEEEEGNPLLGVNTQLIMALNQDLEEKTLKIRNVLKRGTLTWAFGDPVYTRGEDWIKEVSPASGYTTTETDTVKIIFDRDVDLRPGLYSATLPLKSNAGTINITVTILVQEGPVLKTSPFMLIFLTADETKKTLTLSNGKAGTLTWKIDDTDYKRGKGWIKSISPAEGTIEAGTSDVTIEIIRDDLKTGVYRAKIPITSNGGKKEVPVFLLVF
ncbi:MAG: hypothetical protein GY868_17650, partial [Deltaproteobacteria bacterium]|nr:hypothetical protein [Deltaproteobacteria bacterium]